MKDFPLIYSFIVILILLAGFFGLINSWIAGTGEKKLEIVVEFKDMVVFDSGRELDIVFITE